MKNTFLTKKKIDDWSEVEFRAIQSWFFRTLDEKLEENLKFKSSSQKDVLSDVTEEFSAACIQRVKSILLAYRKRKNAWHVLSVDAELSIVAKCFESEINTGLERFGRFFEDEFITKAIVNDNLTVDDYSTKVKEIVINVEKTLIPTHRLREHIYERVESSLREYRTFVLDKQEKSRIAFVERAKKEKRERELEAVRASKIAQLREKLINGEKDEAEQWYLKEGREHITLDQFRKYRSDSKLIFKFCEIYKARSLAELDDFYRLHRCSLGLFLGDFILLKKARLEGLLDEIPECPSPEQIMALSNPSKNHLVRARAGSGKTYTLTSKIVAAVKDENLEPNQVMSLAFNKKAAGEIKKRFEKFTGRPYKNARTFHSLAYLIVRPKKDLIYDDAESMAGKTQSQLLDRAVSRIMNPVFKEKATKYFRWEISQVEKLGGDLSKTEYFSFRRELKHVTLGGETVKSKGEKYIADFLFEHGIDYTYEKYWGWGQKENHQPYRPDFSIEKAGKDYVLEHWAVDPENPEDQLPEYFEQSTDDYKQQSRRKRDFWFSRNIPLLETNAGMIKLGRENFERNLKVKLESAGIPCRRLDEKNIVEKVFQNRFQEQRLTTLFNQFITYAKNSGWNEGDVADRLSKDLSLDDRTKCFSELALRAFEEYEAVCREEGRVDFSSILTEAVRKLKKEGDNISIHLGSGDMFYLRDLRWILIDEFQDCSALFMSLIKAIVDNNSKVKVMAVGDDWQAINGYAGSDLRFFDKFDDLFDESGQSELTVNRRSRGNIVSLGNDLMRDKGSPSRSEDLETENSGVIEKINIRSKDYFIDIRKEEQFIDSRIEGENYQIDKRSKELEQARSAKACVKLILNEEPMSTMVLSRTRRIFGNKFQLTEFREVLLTALVQKTSISRDEWGKLLTCETAHGSKGKEAERVIILEANEGKFPLIHPDNDLFSLFGRTMEKIIQEEKRLFYVALTRAKRDLYFLVDSGKKESPFLTEIFPPKEEFEIDVPRKEEQTRELGQVAKSLERMLGMKLV